MDKFILILKEFKKFILHLLLVFGLFCCYGIIIMLAWNSAIVPIFGITVITFRQAILLAILLDTIKRPSFNISKEFE